MTKQLSIAGAYTALVTPFSSDGSRVDVEAFEALVRTQLDAGIDGLVPCGTTGESPTLNEAEHADIVRRTVTLAAGRVPVIAGTGSNSTHKSVHTSLVALEAGASAVMIVMPYYNKPSQQGLFAHVTSIARELGGAPVVLYNIPGRSVVDLSIDTLARILDAAPNVVAVKDATGNVLRCQQMVGRFGDALSVMSGDDALTLPMMVCGARGVISVTANLYPKHVAQVCSAARSGDWQAARKAHFALLAVHDAMFIEPNPAPIKAALAHQGRVQLALRLPMVPPTEQTRACVVDAMNAFEREVGA